MNRPIGTYRRLGVGSAWRSGFEPHRDVVPTALIYPPNALGYRNQTFYVTATLTEDGFTR